MTSQHITIIIIYCQIFHEVKITRQRNLVSEWNISGQIFFLQESCRKLGRESSSRPSLCFVDKLYMRSDEVVYSLVSIYFVNPQLKNKLCETLE